MYSINKSSIYSFIALDIGVLVNEDSTWIIQVLTEVDNHIYTSLEHSRGVINKNILHICPLMKNN